VLRGPTGDYTTISSAGGETVRAFVPHPLPPQPGLEIDAALREKLDSALLALGRLDSVTTLLPDTRLFLYMYIRKEAVLSSQIEGTQSTLSDLLLFEADALPGVPVDDIREVSNYVAAIEHGLKRIREGFPLSNRLVREVHGILLRRGRGSEKDPGEFRRSQNWFGGTRPGNALYVPPPADRIADLMGQLERWLHNQPEATPVLLKAALSHVQFETIHPFLDGNGRVGRLLVTLLLCASEVLHEPLLYLSLYLKQHRSEYYDLLTRVRTSGEWEAWVDFFAAGILESANGAVHTARRLVDQVRVDRETIKREGRAAGTALRVLDAMSERPIANVRTLVSMTSVSTPAVHKAVQLLMKLGLVKELTGKRRGLVFSYTPYVAILSEGTQPL
jgi:Fic family protein